MDALQAAQAMLDLMDGPVDVEDGARLHQLVGHYWRLLPTDAAVGILAGSPGDLSCVAHPEHPDAQETAGLLELLPAEGPCLDCYRSGKPVPEVALDRAGPVWPRFAPAARAAGFETVCAVPLRRGDEVVGAVALLAAVAGRIGPGAFALARLLADAAAAGIVHRRALTRAQTTAAQLQRALDARVVVEQAVGMLAQHWGVAPREAWERLRRYARAHRARVADVARALVEHEVSPDVVGPRSG